MKYDFSGYATKNNLKCSDGRIIKRDAFKDNDRQTVPLVWQHMQNEPANILGHAVLENREDGVYAYCKFNNNTKAIEARELVKHGDITNLSIYANKLKQDGNSVLHGFIREVSLVLTGANPGATIDNIAFSHSNGDIVTDEEEAIIHTGLNFTLSAEEETVVEKDKKDLKHEEAAGKTVQDVFNTLNEEQKTVVYALLAAASGDEDQEDDAEHSDNGGNEMKKNVFDKTEEQEDNTLAHAELMQAAAVSGLANKGSLRSEVDALLHAGTYGINDIEFLFPDAKTLTSTPDFISRQMGWVSKVLNGTHHSPFSRVKSIHANITADEARAKGYIKGNEKTNEVFGLLKRVTTPQTIYKKQKLDRDDVIDIVDFDVVAWMRGEMRLMLNEELARAILIGDGREGVSDDKINETNIRPIYTDADLYAIHVTVPFETAYKDLVDSIVLASIDYQGTGSPSMFTTKEFLTNMLLMKDSLGRRLYQTKADLASALLVSDIIEVPVFKNVTRVVGPDTRSLLAIIVNLQDYNIGADKGGEVNMFDDFDIDFNQMKYLLETRCSGALTVPYSAIVIERAPEVVGG